MVEEAYVSFETAKLLKEKGFNEQTRDFYRFENNIWIHRNTYEYHYFNLDMPGWKNCYSCPTQQMAMSWLREVHNIGIFPSIYTHISDRKTIHSYGTAIINLKTYELMTDSYLLNDTYEEACEAGILYTLKNLI